MKKIVGNTGTVSGMSLRMGQCGFAAASIGVMVFSRGFTGHTDFCYLIASMGLQLLWSFGLACLDIYALVTATLSLAAACSSTRVIILYAGDLDVYAVQLRLPCAKFHIAVVLSFLTWGLIALSSHVMFWILASMQFEFLPTLPKSARSLYIVAAFFLLCVLFSLMRSRFCIELASMPSSSHSS